jgi:hypothetical protein
MSTFLQFSHTDDIGMFANGSPVKSAPIGHFVGGPTPEGPCLACEWAAAMHSSSNFTPGIHFEQQDLVLLSSSVPTVLHLHCFDANLLRGPPQFIS